MILERMFNLAAVGTVGIVFVTIAGFPMVYDTIHVSDTLFWAQLGRREYLGFSAVQEFQSFYGSIGPWFVALAMQVFGVTIKAVDYAMLLQFALLSAAAGVICFRRTTPHVFFVLLLLIAGCILTVAPLEENAAINEIAAGHSFSYNRFATAIAAIVIFFTVVPASSRPADIAAGIAAGVIVYLAAMAKSTFAILMVGMLAGLVLQARWVSLGGVLGGILAGALVVDFGAADVRGSFGYLLSTGAEGVGIIAVVQKFIRLLFTQLPALLVSAAIVLAHYYPNLIAGWRSLLAVLFVTGGALAMTPTMGHPYWHFGMQIVPIAVAAAVAVAALSRQQQQATAGLQHFVAVVLVAAFALPHLANTLGAAYMATNRAGLVEFQDGPLAGYLGWNRSFAGEDGQALRQKLPVETMATLAAQHLADGKHYNAGTRYAQLADGVRALEKIDGISDYGIVADQLISFEFAMNAKPVLVFPTWPWRNAPELADGVPLSDEIDAVLLSRQQTGWLTDRLAQKMGEDFALCIQTPLWDIHVRASRIAPACEGAAGTAN